MCREQQQGPHQQDEDDEDDDEPEELADAIEEPMLHDGLRAHLPMAFGEQLPLAQVPCNRHSFCTWPPLSPNNNNTALINIQLHAAAG